jgi:predicted metal-dependent HD superfamily phosphohydrolase
LQSEADRRVEQLADDYQQFKDEHARRGGEITRSVLQECGVPTADRVAELVAKHERQSNDDDIALLNDADALSFFSLNSSGYADYFGEEQTRKKVAYTWNRMRPAARAKLAAVHLRGDIRNMLDELR